MTEDRTTRSTQTMGSILASKKNAFREKDNREMIDTLSAEDEMLIRFVDDTYVHSITVEESSITVNGAVTAICDVTYLKKVGIRKEEVTEKFCIVRLPIRNGHPMIVTSKGKVISELQKNVANIKLRRKKGQKPH